MPEENVLIAIDGENVSTRHYQHIVDAAKNYGVIGQVNVFAQYHNHYGWEVKAEKTGITFVPTCREFSTKKRNRH